MLKSLFKRNKVEKKAAPSVESAAGSKDVIMSRILDSPLEPRNYADLAGAYVGKDGYMRRLALFKSAQFLSSGGADFEIPIIKILESAGAFSHIRKRLELSFLGDDEKREIEGRIEGKEDTWSLEGYTYGLYKRLKMVSDKVKEFDGDPSILDAGGGAGIMALVLEKNPYLIVEPTLNGLDATKLPFEDSSFDISVSCDVLEHIPKASRGDFLDEICRVTKKSVFITAPFGPSNRRLEEILFEMTGNPITKEHLDHEYSTQKEVKNFLEAKGFGVVFHPVSYEPLHLAITVLADKLIKNEPKSSKKFHMFFNTEYAPITTLEPSYTYLLQINLERR